MPHRDTPPHSGLDYQGEFDEPTPISRPIAILLIVMIVAAIASAIYVGFGG